jgi:hypothetical protein
VIACGERVDGGLFVRYRFLGREYEEVAFTDEI